MWRKKEHSCTGSGNVNYYDHLEKNGCALKKWNSYIQTIPLMGVGPKKLNQHQNNSSMPMFIVALFTIAELNIT